MDNRLEIVKYCQKLLTTYYYYYYYYYYVVQYSLSMFVNSYVKLVLQLTSPIYIK